MSVYFRLLRRGSHGLHRYQVEYDESFDNILIVDGVPIIDKAKLEKLLQKIAKDFSRKGCPIKPENITVPWNDAAGKSKGCVPPSVLLAFAGWGTNRGRASASSSSSSRTRTMRRVRS